MIKKIFNKKYLAYLLLVISIILYGFYTGVQKQALELIQSPFEFAFYTMIFSSIFLFPGAAKKYVNEKVKINKKFLIALVLMSIATQFVALSTKLFALQYTTATSVGFVSIFSSVFLTIYAVIITKEKLPKFFVPILILMSLGLVLFRFDLDLGINFGIGEFLALAFINITSIVNAFTKNFTKKYPPAILSFARMFFAIPFLGIAAHLTNGIHLDLMFSIWPILAGLLFAGRNLTLYSAFKLTKLSNVAVINLFGPLVTFAYAYVFLEEELSVIQMLGAGVILLGAWLVYLVKKK